MSEPGGRGNSPDVMRARRVLGPLAKTRPRLVTYLVAAFADVRADERSALLVGARETIARAIYQRMPANGLYDALPDAVKAMYLADADAVLRALGVEVTK